MISMPSRLSIFERFRLIVLCGRHGIGWPTLGKTPQAAECENSLIFLRCRSLKLPLLAARAYWAGHLGFLDAGSVFTGNLEGLTLWLAGNRASTGPLQWRVDESPLSSFIELSCNLSAGTALAQ
jgi:hypothetical protein